MMFVESMHTKQQSGQSFTFEEFKENYDKLGKKIEDDFRSFEFTPGNIIEEELKCYQGITQCFYGEEKGLTKNKFQKLMDGLHKEVEEHTGVPMYNPDKTKSAKKASAPSKYKQDPIGLLAHNREKHDSFMILTNPNNIFLLEDGKTTHAIHERLTKTPAAEKFGKETTRYCKHKDGGVKEIGRVTQKYLFKYNLDATKIVDLLRCSYIFKDPVSLYNGIILAVKYFLEKHQESNPKATVKDCLWMKDRFKYPLDGGYRDVILMVKIPNSATDDDGQDLWGEIQFHLSEAMEKKCDLHKLYDVMRHFPKPQEVTKKVVSYHTSLTKERASNQEKNNLELAQEKKTLEKKAQEKKNLETIPREKGSREKGSKDKRLGTTGSTREKGSRGKNWNLSQEKKHQKIKEWELDQAKKSQEKKLLKKALEKKDFEAQELAQNQKYFEAQELAKKKKPFEALEQKERDAILAKEEKLRQKKAAGLIADAENVEN